MKISWQPEHARLLFLAIALVWSVAGHASNIEGVVTDRLGAVISNATVELVADGESLSSTRTDPQGKYHLTFTKSGRVHLHIQAPTFAAENTAAFYVGGGNETITCNVFLRPENVSQKVVVTATGVPVSQAQVGAPVDVLAPSDYLNDLDILQALSSVLGLQVTQTGQRGGATSVFIRGGNSNANKVLLDGVPVNDIGGVVDFGDLEANGLENVEVLRGPNSVLYGSDALAGVVSLTTRRGTTPLPQLEYSVEAGNFGTRRQEGILSGAWRRFDYLADAERFDSANSVPNSQFHNGTFAGNLGWSLSAANRARLTLRRIATALGLPGAVDLYGLPDDGAQQDHDTFLSATWENQATPNWHNVLRYGASRLVRHFEKLAAMGSRIDGSLFGLPVTIHGANGFSTSGQAFLSTTDCCPSTSVATAQRDFVYAQTDYQLKRYVNFLLAYRYEAERGESRSNSPQFASNERADRRNSSFIVETHGDVRNRTFYAVGGSLENNAVFGLEATPRVSLAFYPLQSGSGVFRTTKLNFNFGKGIKEPSIFDEDNSLFRLLEQQPDGSRLIQKFGIRPIGAERSRSYDLGVEQSFASRVQWDVSLFHNQFTNEIEFVTSNALPGLGVPAAVATATGFGATLNSADFRAQGAETKIVYRISDSIAARAGYTYLDASVERSFSSDALSPAFNPLFPRIPIGALGPLVGARPFRRAPHSGFLALTYAHSRFSGLFQGTFVSRRDDSTFLLFSDLNFGNTLLLPNRNLDRAYQKLDLSAAFRLTNYLTCYIAMENLLSQHYDAAFGFPSLPFAVRSGLKITLGGESWHRK
ncbi:MAG: TonB-dependent receptor plug domain-containing protein [Acidobacteria bacterium]|nr:TonB-dependent receptor plug domain-containing protein [Acidobacteriota bacterium]